MASFPAVQARLETADGADSFELYIKDKTLPPRLLKHAFDSHAFAQAAGRVIKRVAEAEAPRTGRAAAIGYPLNTVALTMSLVRADGQESKFAVYLPKGRGRPSLPLLRQAFQSERFREIIRAQFMDDVRAKASQVEENALFTTPTDREKPEELKFRLVG